MASIQSSTDTRLAKPEMSLRDRLAGYMASGLDLFETDARRKAFPDISKNMASELMPIVENVPGVGQGLSAEDFGKASLSGDWLGMGTAALGLIPGLGGEKKAAEGVADVASSLLHKSGAPLRETPSGQQFRLPPTLTKEQAVQAKVVPEAVARAPNPEPTPQGPAMAGYQPRFLENVRLPERPQFQLPRFSGATPSPRVQDMLKNPKVQQGVFDAIQKGKEMGGPEWYVTDPLLKRYIDIFGNDLGREMHQRDMFMQAATSPQHKVPANINVASEYSRVATQNPDKIITRGDPITPGYGHYVQKLHQDYAGDVQGAGFINSVTQPKPPSFGNNLAGNYQPVAVDIHATRYPAILSQDPRWLNTEGKAALGGGRAATDKAPGIPGMTMEELIGDSQKWDDKPHSFTEYPFMEKMYQDLSHDAGLRPAEGQASTWLSAGGETGLGTDSSLPWLGMYEDAAAQTGRWLNMDPQDVIDQVIRGDRAFETETGYKARTGKKPPQ